MRACQSGRRVLFVTAAQWATRPADTNHTDRLESELIKLGRNPLMVDDEVGYIFFEAEAANLLFHSSRAAPNAPVCRRGRPQSTPGGQFSDAGSRSDSSGKIAQTARARR
nr:ATP-binding protein [Rhodococcus sp. 4CII]